MDRALPALNEGESHLVLFHTHRAADGRAIFAKAFRGDAAQPLLAARESATHPLEDGTTVSLSDFLKRAAEAARNARRADGRESEGGDDSDSDSGGAPAALGMKRIRAFPKVMTRAQARRRAQQGRKPSAAPSAKGRSGSAATQSGRAKAGRSTAPPRPAQRASGGARARSAPRRPRPTDPAPGARPRADRGRGKEAEESGETVAGRERLEEDMKESPHVAWGAEPADRDEVDDLGFADAEEELDLDELDDVGA